MNKGGTDIIIIPIMFAVGLIVIFMIYQGIVDIRTRMCKTNQMSEFKKIWDELRYFKSQEGTGTVGYNTVEDVGIEWCVERLWYDTSNINEKNLK